MINVDALIKTYICFNNVVELKAILTIFQTLWFKYKNGSYENAYCLAHNSCVDKITCHDNFVMTSKEKVATISYKVFMKLADSLTNNTLIINNNTMNMKDSNPKAIINEIRASKLFKDEEYLEWLVAKADEVGNILSNFMATLDKAEDKANKVSDLLEAYTAAIADKDVAEIEKLTKLINSSIKYITKTNKILSAISDTGSEIIKTEKKEEKATGKTFIWE